MAANINVDVVADSIGIRDNNRYSFDANSRGVAAAYTTMSLSSKQYRSK